MCSSRLNRLIGMVPASTLKVVLAAIVCRFWQPAALRAECADNPPTESGTTYRLAFPEVADPSSSAMLVVMADVASTSVEITLPCSGSPITDTASPGSPDVVEVCDGAQIDRRAAT